jgi:hypothetical protein
MHTNTALLRPLVGRFLRKRMASKQYKQINPQEKWPKKAPR